MYNNRKIALLLAILINTAGSISVLRKHLNYVVTPPLQFRI